VVLTGPLRVVLDRLAVGLVLPLEACTLDELLNALTDTEPRIARYLRREDELPAAPLRPLFQANPLSRGA